MSGCCSAHDEETPDGGYLVSDFLASLRKVTLHDHLDGALRPATIIDLAREQGYGDLPTTDVDALADWFDQGMPGNSLETYLTTFTHTVALMQNEDAIRRVTREWVEDVAGEGVDLGEVRVAPELMTSGGLTMERVVDVIADELEESGSRLGVRAGLICCAMRTADHSLAVARLVADRVGSNVIAFDLAGSEKGGPALRHKEAIDLVHAAGGKVTLHAGEGDGVDSIRQAVVDCRAHRIGHGVRIVEDIDFSGSVPRFGEVAQFVHERGIPLEVCPTSNLHTGLYASLGEHPISVLDDLGFVVTVNPDNRLMSRTSLTREFAGLMAVHGWDEQRVNRVTAQARAVAFLA
ncbi:MAG: adenosine deaminase [Actinobacteria bacterium]|nr:adenosine deaminase [Actinomycetota bacterium]